MHRRLGNPCIEDSGISGKFERSRTDEVPITNSTFLPNEWPCIEDSGAMHRRLGNLGKIRAKSNRWSSNYWFDFSTKWMTMHRRLIEPLNWVQTVVFKGKLQYREIPKLSHLSISYRKENGITQGHIKTRVRFEPMTFEFRSPLRLCPCVGPFSFQGLTIGWDNLGISQHCNLLLRTS